MRNTIVPKKTHVQELIKKKPKPIMINDVENVIELTNDMLSNIRFNFEANIVGRYTRIFQANLRDKLPIHEYLKKLREIQHYLIPDREIPLKIVIRGYSRSTNLELLKKNLFFRGF